jgi:hypothetical protein
MDDDVKLHEKAVEFMTDRALSLTDLLEHQGELYVVVYWQINEALGLRRPQYTIPLKSVARSSDNTVTPGALYALRDQLPKELFLGTATPEQLKRYAVRSGPHVELPLVPTRH